MTARTCGVRAFGPTGRGDESVIGNTFPEAARGLGGDLVTGHYGSSEAPFLERMSARHGGDAEVLTRLKAKAVNVLSAIYARVDVPTHGNDLKSVAGCLGFRWAGAGAPGLPSIAGRHAWGTSGAEATKEQLLTYNREDGSAPELVTAAVRSFGAGAHPAAAAGVRVAGTDEIKPPPYRKYGNSPFALPALASITKCASLDYQRTKVLCRTSPAVRESLARKKRARPRAHKANCDVQCSVPIACPYCGSTGLDFNSRYQRSVTDLKAPRAGIARWVTRYKGVRPRCRTCVKSFPPEDYLTLPIEIRARPVQRGRIHVNGATPDERCRCRVDA